MITVEWSGRFAVLKLFWFYTYERLLSALYVGVAATANKHDAAAANDRKVRRHALVRSNSCPGQVVPELRRWQNAAQRNLRTMQALYGRRSGTSSAHLAFLRKASAPTCYPPRRYFCAALPQLAAVVDGFSTVRSPMANGES